MLMGTNRATLSLLQPGVKCSQACRGINVLKARQGVLFSAELRIYHEDKHSQLRAPVEGPHSVFGSVKMANHQQNILG